MLISSSSVNEARRTQNMWQNYTNVYNSPVFILIVKILVRIVYIFH